ncbi:hypothetical protein U9M48_042499, partial [Paspalum notatum var. saurae]
MYDIKINWNDFPTGIDNLIDRLEEEPGLSLALVEAHVEHASQLDVIDWDALHIIDPQDEEGRVEIVDENQMYDLLGLRAEDEAAKEASDDDTTGAAIPVDDDIPGERVMVHDPNKPSMALGTTYPNMVVFRLAMRQFAINEEFKLRIDKSDQVRYVAGCKHKNCPWRIVGRRQPDGNTIMVTVLVDKHNCTSNARKLTTTPSSAWVASKAIHHLRKNYNMGPKELKQRLEEEHNCKIHYDTVWKGRQKALVELHGSWEESFQMLFNWRAEVMARSPGSVIEIDVKEEDGQVHFHKFFCALGPCIEGFLEGCRTYLSIDSTALNGRLNGHLAAATAIDGHNWMYPVAFGFIDGETEDNWVWFMTQLKRAIGDLPLLAVCTDACKGLENAVKKVFPQAEQRECFRHLMQNFIKRYGGEIFSRMYPIARAYRKEVSDYFYNQIVESSTEADTWLKTHHKLKWKRSSFNPAIKCDYVTNNIAEIFNNWVKDWKDLPMVELADKIRELIMFYTSLRRRIGAKLHGKILPAVLHQLEARTRGLGHLTVTQAGFFSAQVEDSSNTHNRHHTGKPCQHALALITSQESLDVKLEDFVHDYYSVERFKNAYKRIIEPLPDRTQWPHVDLPFVVGAPLRRGKGRWKKLRMKSCLEGGNSKGKKAAAERGKEADKGAANEADLAAGTEPEKVKKQMVRGKRKCKGCGELGHGKTSYKCPLNGTKKRQEEEGPKNTTKYGENAKVPCPKKAKKGAAQENEVAGPANETGAGAAQETEEAVTENQSPTKPTRESIFHDSPIRVTRSRLAMLLGDGSTSPTTMMLPSTAKKTPPKKLTPRKLKI